MSKPKDEDCPDGSCNVAVEPTWIDSDYLTRDLETDIEQAVRARIDEIVRVRKVNRRTAAVLFAKWLSGCKLE